jgi:hypothetical protein
MTKANKTTTASTTTAERFGTGDKARAHLLSIQQRHAALTPLANQYAQLLAAFEEVALLRDEIADIQAALPVLDEADHKAKLAAFDVLEVIDQGGDAEPLRDLLVKFTNGEREYTRAPDGSATDSKLTVHTKGIDSWPDRTLWQAVAKNAAHLLPVRVLAWGEGDALRGLEKRAQFKRQGFVNTGAATLWTN